MCSIHSTKVDGACHEMDTLAQLHGLQTTCASIMRACMRRGRLVCLHACVTSSPTHNGTLQPSDATKTMSPSITACPNCPSCGAPQVKRRPLCVVAAACVDPSETCVRYVVAQFQLGVVMMCLDHRPVADPGVHTERERDCFSRQLLARGSVKEALARLARGDRIDGILPV